MRIGDLVRYTGERTLFLTQNAPPEVFTQEGRITGKGGRSSWVVRWATDDARYVEYGYSLNTYESDLMVVEVGSEEMPPGYAEVGGWDFVEASQAAEAYEKFTESLSMAQENYCGDRGQVELSKPVEELIGSGDGLLKPALASGGQFILPQYLTDFLPTPCSNCGHAEEDHDDDGLACESGDCCCEEFVTGEKIVDTDLKTLAVALYEMGYRLTINTEPVLTAKDLDYHHQLVLPKAGITIGEFTFEGVDPATIKVVMGDDDPVKDEDAKPDMVNHPPHYQGHPKGIECIDVIEDNPFPNLANAMRYLWRVSWGGKWDSMEDMEKAIWYVSREISRRLESEEH